MLVIAPGVKRLLKRDAVVVGQITVGTAAGLRIDVVKSRKRAADKSRPAGALLLEALTDSFAGSRRSRTLVPPLGWLNDMGGQSKAPAPAARRLSSVKNAGWFDAFNTEKMLTQLELCHEILRAEIQKNRRAVQAKKFGSAK